MKKMGLVVLIAVMMMFGVAPAVQAITYNFTSDYCTGGCGTAPFGTVDLLQNGTTVDVTVHLNSPNQFVNTGAADGLAFKFNAIGVVVGDFTVEQNAPIGVLPLNPVTGSFNGSGTGSFTWGIDAKNQGPGASERFNTDIILHVANAVIADLTVPNGKGYVFVADFIGSTGNTGPVAASTPRTSVPEPTTLLLLGLGLVGLAGARRIHK